MHTEKGPWNPTNNEQHKLSMSNGSRIKWSKLSKEEKIKITRNGRETAYKNKVLTAKPKIKKTEDEVHQSHKANGERRMQLMTKEEKSELGRKGANARWHKKEKEKA